LEIDIPAAFSKLFKTGFDWAYETIEQHSLQRRRLYWPRGKVLGGSSSINAMIYCRPGPADHVLWESSGSPGWSWAEVLPYYNRAEPFEDGRSDQHGGNGPVNVSDLRFTNPLSHAFLEACATSGLSRNPDLTEASGATSADAFRHWTGRPSPQR
jgi:choline dehydrogenase